MTLRNLGTNSASNDARYERKITKAGASMRGMFTAKDPRFLVWREDNGSAKAWWFGRRVGPAKWDCFELREVTAGSGHMVSQLRKHEIRTAGTVYETDGTSSGNFATTGTWTSGTTGSANNGSYIRATATSATATFTPPAGAIVISIRNPLVNNGGYGLVKIDGSATRASLLPTAQTEVDAGRLASTALVAGGGTLNPTDRVLNCYAASSSFVNNTTIVDDLSGSEAGVVVVSPTGYKQAASSDVRVYLDTFTSGTDVTGATLAAASSRPLLKQIFGQSSVYEYALHVLPFDVAGSWIGNSHGEDQQTSLVIYVDGKAVVTNGAAYVSGGLANLAGVSGENIVVVRKSTLYDPVTGTTPIATMTVTYSLTTEGVAVETAPNWFYAGTFNTSSYTAMHPVNVEYSRARNVGLAAAVSATSLNNAQLADARSDMMIAWEPGGRWASMMRIPDPSGTANGFPAATALSFEDRAAGDFKKAYALRADSTHQEPFPAGPMRWSAVHGAACLGDVEAVLG